MTRVAVTGLGAVTPLGIGAETFHERWVRGESGLQDGQGLCTEFDPLEFLSRKEIRRLDRFSQLAVTAATEAIEHAGWSEGPPYDPERVACIVGTAFGGIETFEDEHSSLTKGGQGAVSALGIPRLMSNAAPAQIALKHGLKGECQAIVTACASGAQSIGAAWRLIVNDEADAVLVGGADAPVTPLSLGWFPAMGALSPSGRSLPFDKRRDGFVLSEGAGMLVLENAERAVERGAEVLGEIVGFGATTDAFHISAPDPSAGPQSEAISRALKTAGVEPEELCYVNAHGTGTPLNDKIETLALRIALGDAVGKVRVSSVKSAIGHPQGAAGSLEVITTLLALRDRVAPPTIGLEEPDEELGLDYVPGEAQPLEANGRAVGISNSFGFGGHNAVVVVASELESEAAAA